MVGRDHAAAADDPRSQAVGQLSAGWANQTLVVDDVEVKQHGDEVDQSAAAKPLGSDIADDAVFEVAVDEPHGLDGAGPGDDPL